MSSGSAQKSRWRFPSCTPCTLQATLPITQRSPEVPAVFACVSPWSVFPTPSACEFLLIPLGLVWVVPLLCWEALSLRLHYITSLLQWSFPRFLSRDGKGGGRVVTCDRVTVQAWRFLVCPWLHSGELSALTWHRDIMVAASTWPEGRKGCLRGVPRQAEAGGSVGPGPIRSQPGAVGPCGPGSGWYL